MEKCENSENFKKQISELENKMKEKDAEIEKLLQRIQRIDRNFGGKKDFPAEFSFTDDSENEIESDNFNENESVEDQHEIEVVNAIDEAHECYSCDFKSKTDQGLRIHVGKMHHFKCDQCDETFTRRSCLEKHKNCKEILKLIKNPTNGDFKIGKFRRDETCIGIFSDKIRNQNDLGVPVIFLHSMECWQDTGLSCPELSPDHKPDERVVVDCVDLNVILHMMQQSFVIMGMVDWDSVKETVAEHFNLFC